MQSRRHFVKTLAAGALYVPAINLLACKSEKKDEITPGLNISLAQWSLHRAFEKGELNPIHFPAIARQYEISAIEYVNGFYRDKATDEKFWNELKQTAANEGVQNLLIMIDEEGDLGNVNAVARTTAVENHYKWLNAAHLLGCHSVRVNAFGEGSSEEVQKAMIDSMQKLGEYAAPLNLNVLIENHGLYSSNGKWVAEVIKQSGKENCGTLPDFGNWCLSAKWGTTQIECSEVYDRYQGVADLLPYAKGVSAKSYAFDADGNETRIDYLRLIKLVKDSGFTGYVGIEFEGFDMAEPDGIRATKKLLEQSWKKITGE
ncbi:MAG TPA: TIM barrel protein [Cyclobacteriaceae bacterium]|jgi:sugar phosphate isomerase/epimerase|nr:TIM barrel protein [Cytophagales bacterium]HRE65998.1 TIM barrel protein [Cyclobacteriaceae bacterium]HRF33970.1 TIM barrel protein [Cyclobacteriaceae bacterium]